MRKVEKQIVFEVYEGDEIKAMIAKQNKSAKVFIVKEATEEEIAELLAQKDEKVRIS